MLYQQQLSQGNGEYVRTGKDQTCNLARTHRYEVDRKGWTMAKDHSCSIWKNNKQQGNRPKKKRRKKEERKPSMKARGLLNCLQRQLLSSAHDRTEENKDQAWDITENVIDCPTTNKVECSLKPVSYAMNWALNGKSQDADM